MVDQYGETPEREPAAPEIREVDAVEAEEVRLYGVGVLTEERDERRQFPEIPRAPWRAVTKGSRSATFGSVARNAA